MEKKRAYPVIIHKDPDGFVVDIPDFDSGTQGETLVEAIEMARDAIGLLGIELEDEGKEIPASSDISNYNDRDGIATLVDIDFEEYRKKADNRAVRKNCSLPYWMVVAAEKENINCSKVLQEALANILKMNNNVAR